LNDFIVFSMLFFLFVLFFILYRFLLKKRWIKQYVHPYTNKVSRETWFDYFQLFLLMFALLYSLFFFQFTLFVLFAFVFSLMLYLFIKKNEKNPFGEIQFEWAYTSDEQNEWKQALTEKRDWNRKVLIRNSVTNRIIFTDKFVFFGNRRKIPVFMQPFDHLELSNVTIQSDFLVFHYSFRKLIDVNYRAFFIPKNKKEEARKIISFYSSILSKNK